MARPTKYLKEFSKLLIDHMKVGHSFSSFGAIANCCEDTLYEWVKRFPEFSDAKKVGERYGYKALEDIGFDLMRNGSASAWIFTMKNRFGWRDRKEPYEGDEPRTKEELLEKLKQAQLKLESEIASETTSPVN